MKNKYCFNPFSNLKKHKHVDHLMTEGLVERFTSVVNVLV